MSYFFIFCSKHFIPNKDKNIHIIKIFLQRTADLMITLKLTCSDTKTRNLSVHLLEAEKIRALKSGLDHVRMSNKRMSDG